MGSEPSYDLIVIGSGPGGYVAAVRASQLGMKVACIEKEERLGGVCLNLGCIPSKALLDSSEYYQLARSRFADHGIRTGKIRLDLPAMMSRKDRVVAELTENVSKLLKGHHIDIVRGKARLIDSQRVEVVPPAQDPSERRTLRAGSILLATGSRPVLPENLAVDGKRIVGSTEALGFDAVPKHLVVVGGGYIGLELGSVWLRLGAKVTVIETLPRIGTGLDGQVARALHRILTRQGMVFRLNTTVMEATATPNAVRVKLQTDSDPEIVRCDRLLVAVGRRPLIEDLGIDRLGIETDPKTGHIRVDAAYRTTLPGVYAIGDLVAGPMLAHKASAEGIAAVECMAGLPGEVNYEAIPSVIYTWPEVASVGLTEAQVKQRDIPHCIGTYPFSGAGRARCMGETEGFVKLIVHAKTDRILGAHIIGPRAADMIAECVLAMEFSAGAEDIARTVHGHPSFAEALQEAAMAARSCSIHAS